MKQYRLLILTDHSNHSKANSLYKLAKAMAANPLCAQVDVATRGLAENSAFFNGEQSDYITVNEVTNDFEFSPNGDAFQHGKRRERLSFYQIIWLRLPPPLSIQFLDFLQQKLNKHFIINSPKGIYETGSKAFLMNFADCCPPMKICTSVDDIIQFKNQFPIVLKPYREYGGKGIVKIQGDKVFTGKQEMSFEAFIDGLNKNEIAYLGVKFLKNVSQGDKRIVVVNGKIMGAALRLPAKDSWLCNVSMGGTSNHAEVDEEERMIIAKINPTLSRMGIVMYGVDTLVGDNGKRMLSEINTTSIGGLPDMASFSGKPLLEEATSLILNYFITKNTATL